MRTLLVHNPTAGTGDHEKEELLAILRLAGHDVTYASSKDDRLPAVLKGDFDLIVIAGGDGTVRKVTTKLKKRKAAIAIFPHGTANNIANSLGMIHGRQEMAVAWHEGKHAPLDIGIASGPWGKKPFIEGVGIGALAAITNDEVGADFEGEKRILIGRAHFHEALEKQEPLHIKITIDGKPLDGEWLMVEVMNNKYTGPALPLAPKADSGDGLLEVVVLAADRRQEMLDWLGSPDDARPPVETRRGKVVDMVWTGKPVLRVDDSPVRIPKGKQRVEVKFQEEPLQVMLPELKGSRKSTRKASPRKASTKDKADKKGDERRSAVAA